MFKAVRAPRLAPWASERHKREVRKYAVETLVYVQKFVGDQKDLGEGFEGHGLEETVG